MTEIIYAWNKSVFSYESEEVLGTLAPYIGMVKIGLEAITAEDDIGASVGATVRGFVRDGMGLGVMWDAKFHDIPNTMAAAARKVAKWSEMFTLHASAGSKAMEAVAKACEESSALPLAVTVLTSLDDAECQSIYGDTPGKKVVQFARMALDSGIRGLVCSPQELIILGDAGLLSKLTTVIPCIRPVWAKNKDDQSRTMTPGEAVRAGADYLVIGRPISQPPRNIGTPAKAARLIKAEMDAASKRSL